MTCVHRMRAFLPLWTAALARKYEFVTTIGYRRRRMDTFMIGSRRLWLLRAVGRNPLVRRSDRVEAWSVLLAVLVLAVATPFVCAYGTSVHDARAAAVCAGGTASPPGDRHRDGGGRRDGEPGSTAHTVRGRWSAFGQEHVNIVKWSEHANVGDQQRIWVDDAGHEAMAPRSASLAANDVGCWGSLSGSDSSAQSQGRCAPFGGCSMRSDSRNGMWRSTRARESRDREPAETRRCARQA